MKCRSIAMGFLLTILPMQQTMVDNIEKLEVDTPEGPVSATRTTVNPSPQEIKVVSNELRETFRGWANLGPEFVAHYVSDSSEFGLKRYDQAFRAWQLADSRGYADQQVVEILGSVLGNKMERL